MSAAGALTPFEAAILGLVEGLTEYLPVSSTGHLILVAAWLGKEGDPAVNAFNIVIQAGAILAVLGLYRDRVASMLVALRDLLRGGAPALKALRATLHARFVPGLNLLANLLVAFLPAAILGPLLEDRIESALFYPVPVAAALALGGLVIFAFEPLRRRRLSDGVGIETLGMRGALFIGLIQCLAMIPGTSRSLATILGGIAVGLHPAAAAEFSFLLGLPTLGGATFIKAIGDGDLLLAEVGPLSLLVGLAVATVSAALAVKGFVAWLNRHGLAGFGVYRIVLAALVFLAMTGRL